MDRFGYAKTVDGSVYERNREAADKENKYILRCMNTGKLCLFTSGWQDASDQSDGSPLWKIQGQRISNRQCK